MSPTVRVLAVVLSALALLPATNAQAQDPFVGEIRTFGYTFCPQGWLMADGQVLPISTYTVLFSLLGNRFGGDGTTKFALPDLRGRTIIGSGQGPGLLPSEAGASGGNQTVTLTQATLPPHTHAIPPHTHSVMVPGQQVTTVAAATGSGTSQVLSAEGSSQTTAQAQVSEAPLVAGVAGGGQPIDIRNPYLAMTVCIANSGLYPPRP
jgi:microcystin-dependent protein